MTLLKVMQFGAFVLIGATSAAMAQATYTKGTVKNVKPEDGKVTIIHEEIANLEMPAMTMVFVVPDEAMFEELEEGADIEFVVERVDGKLAITDIR